MRAILGISALIAMLASVPAAATQDDVAGATQTIADFHAALSAGEPKKARASLGETFFIGDERSGADPERLSAHFFRDGESLDLWPERFLAEAGPYRNAFRVVSSSVRSNGAVVVTRDTGSNKFRSWKDEEVVWLLGRTSGGWRIVAMIIRDIQLPK